MFIHFPAARNFFPPHRRQRRHLRAAESHAMPAPRHSGQRISAGCCWSSPLVFGFIVRLFWGIAFLPRSGMRLLRARVKIELSSVRLEGVDPAIELRLVDRRPFLPEARVRERPERESFEAF